MLESFCVADFCLGADGKQIVDFQVLEEREFRGRKREKSRLGLGTSYCGVTVVIRTGGANKSNDSY